MLSLPLLGCLAPSCTASILWRFVQYLITLLFVSVPGGRPLDVTGAAGGEAEGVDDHVALVGGDGYQLVVHVLLLAHSHVSGQEKRLYI